jgi:hypothetical protein
MLGPAVLAGKPPVGSEEYPSLLKQIWVHAHSPFRFMAQAGNESLLLSAKAAWSSERSFPDRSDTPSNERKPTEPPTDPQPTYQSGDVATLALIGCHRQRRERLPPW